MIYITTVPYARDTGSGKEGSPPGALTSASDHFPSTTMYRVAALVPANAHFPRTILCRVGPLTPA